MTEIYEYAKLLDHIGTKIVEAADSLPTIEPIEKCDTLSKINAHLESLRNAMKDFVESRNMLTSINPPKVISDEHKQLIDAYEVFLAGTSTMILSINLSPITVDQEKYHIGYAMQRQGVSRVVDTIKRIGDKLKRK